MEKAREKFAFTGGLPDRPDAKTGDPAVVTGRGRIQPRKAKVK
jgi:hypothetical protein